MLAKNSIFVGWHSPCFAGWTLHFCSLLSTFFPANSWFVFIFLWLSHLYQVVSVLATISLVNVHHYPHCSSFFPKISDTFHMYSTCFSRTFILFFLPRSPHPPEKPPPECQEHGATATFFLCSDYVNGFEEEAEKLLAENHEFLVDTIGV